MSHAEFLNALATVCETAERIPVCHPTRTCYPASYPAVPTYITPRDPTTPYQTVHAIPPPFQVTSSYPVAPAVSPYSSRPTTPDLSGASSPMPMAAPIPRFRAPNNLILQNVLAHTQFQHYLDETWPENSLRRGSAVIQGSLYSKIAYALRGGEVTARFKHWVKKSEFFLMERVLPGVGYGACLAVPSVKGRTGKKASSKHEYKLVARSEDFAYIIGSYHNHQKGHSGIRRTYAMIQEDFSYLPRAAVAKFIELCDVCALHRTKTNQSLARRKATPVEIALEESVASTGGSSCNLSVDTGYESSVLSDSRNTTPTFDKCGMHKDSASLQEERLDKENTTAEFEITS